MSLLEMGVEEVIVTADVASAFNALQAHAVDAALVDIFLGNDDGRIIADRLEALGIAYGLMTGLGDPEGLQAQRPGIPILTKPFSKEELAAVLDRLC